MVQIYERFHYLYPQVKKRESALYLGIYYAKRNPNVEDVPQLPQSQKCVFLNIFDFSRTHAKSIREHSPDLDPTYVGLKPSLMWG